MAEYNLLFSHSATNALPVLFPPIIEVPVIVIKADILMARGADWIRVGWVQAVSGSAIGLINGEPKRVNKGRQEFQLEVPEYPYQLAFTPRSYIEAWSILVYEKILEPQAVPLSLDSNLVYQKLVDVEAKIDAL